MCVEMGIMPEDLRIMSVKLPILNQKWYLDVLDTQYQESLTKDKRWNRKRESRFVSLSGRIDAYSHICDKKPLICSFEKFIFSF